MHGDDCRQTSATGPGSIPMYHIIQVGMNSEVLKQLDDLRQAYPHLYNRKDIVLQLVAEAHANFDKAQKAAPRSFSWSLELILSRDWPLWPSRQCQRSGPGDQKGACRAHLPQQERHRFRGEKALDGDAGFQRVRLRSEKSRLTLEANSTETCVSYSVSIQAQKAEFRSHASPA
jgi:hypothetical protein